VARLKGQKQAGQKKTAKKAQHKKFYRTKLFLEYQGREILGNFLPNRAVQLKNVDKKGLFFKSFLEKIFF
jgi:hypothetical protein